jgi:haloacetate dehalogenase
MRYVPWDVGGSREAEQTSNTDSGTAEVSGADCHDGRMFEGFEKHRSADGIEMRIGGDGPPLLLLHGYPQTHVMWHAVAPRLARNFTVVAADLPGYGDSDPPPVAADHAQHSKRVWAARMVAAMRETGFERFAVCGHDRGARVAYRMALDHPARVSRVAVLDIVPTAEAYDRADCAFGVGYWHWFFLIQPAPFPETLIGHDPDAFFEGSLMKMAEFDPQAIDAYRASWRRPATIQAMCEDYRAGVGIDSDLDRADRAAGRKITVPLLALWGTLGAIGVWYDPLALWGEWAADVSGRAVDATHFLVEDRPEDVAGLLEEFLLRP